MTRTVNNIQLTLKGYGIIPASLFWMLLCVSGGLHAQCLNNSQYGSVVAPVSGTATIETCNFYGEYSDIANVQPSSIYICGIQAGGYVTIRRSSPNGVVVAHGPSPLTWTSSTAGSYYAHWTADENCNTSFSCQTTYITYVGSAVTCTGTPVAGQVNANGIPASYAACANSSIAFTLSGAASNFGVTYTWQYSASGNAGSYAAIPAATSSIYSIGSFSNANEGFYQCRLTCATSGLISFSSPVQITAKNFTDCYCPSQASTSYDEEIFSMTLNGASTNPLYANAAGCSTVAPGQGSVLGSYSNFKSLGSLNNLPLGSLANFELVEDECDGPFYFAFGASIWIDFNHNGSFNDAGENVFVESTTLTGPRIINSSFLVPNAALLGNTVMRVTVAEGFAGNLLSPCLQYNYGETEDYLVNIVPNTSCAGVPNPGSVIPNPITVCPGGTLNLSLQNYTPGNGVTYQWFNNAGLISGATNSTLTLNGVTSADDYYCDVTCGAVTTASQIVSVPLNNFYNCYCSPNSSFGTAGATYGVISNVSINSLQNASSYPVSNPYVTEYPSTVVTTDLTPGLNYLLNVSVDAFTQVAVWFDWNQDGVFGQNEFYNIGNNNTALPVSFTSMILVPLSALSGQTRMRLRSEANFYTLGAGDACTQTNYGESEDYTLTINSVIACNGTPTPGNTVVTSNLVCPGSNVNFFLQNQNQGLGIQYQWFENTLPIAGATNNFYTATINNAMSVHCQLTCMNSGLTTFSTPVSVALNQPTACYCQPSYTVGKTDGDLISDVSILGTSLANNTGSGASNPAYTYYQTSGGIPANLTADLQAASSYYMVVTFGSFPNGGQNAAAWIDYNDDGIFTVNERIGYTTAASQGAFGLVYFPILIACNPPIGTHRLRVRNVYGVPGVTIDPCSVYAYGETEDYDITILAPLPCPQPTGLTASNITYSEADLDWQSGCSETLWDVHIGPVGNGQPMLSPSHPSVVKPFHVTGLLPLSSYEYWVRADCGSGAGQSNWSGPYTLNTTIGPCSGMPNAGSIIASDATVCQGGNTTLSLSGESSGQGITYQWYSGAGLISGATNASYTVSSLLSPETYYCGITCMHSGLTASTSGFTVQVNTPGTGTSITNPIVVGQAPCQASPFIDIKTNSTANCFSNGFGQASPEIWYQFTLSAPTTVTLSHCGSSLDTYMHLLDGQGNLVAYNDDLGPLCASIHASLVQLLPAGTYYVVSEGYGALTGSITTSISTVDACNTTLSVTCMIEAYYDGVGGMLPALSNQGQIVPAGVCDSVDIELHDANAPYGLLYTSRVVLNQNGTATALFPSLTGSYYIVLTHRNALQTWSASPVLMGSMISYDFTTAASQAYGSNQAEVAPGVFAFYSGDVVKDLGESTDLLDLTQVETDINNFGFGYIPTDLNGDGNVDILDTPQLENNIANFIFTQRP